MSKNDVTGDEIKSRVSTVKCRDNWETVFGSKKKDYPQWVCGDCGSRYGNKPCGISTWHNDICGVCGNTRPVTEPRDFGHLKQEWIKHK